MIAIAAISCLLLIRFLTSDGASITTGRRSSVVVKLVFDGDTFETEDGRRVRLLGIDSPEVAHGDTPAEAWGKEAGNWLRSELIRKTVTLEIGAEPYDHYGRTLAWVYDERGELINERALATGNAKLLARFGLPHHLEERLRMASAKARRNRLGLWSLEK